MSKESQKAFYTKQREDAIKSGDAKTVNKIYSKLGKKDAEADNKATDAQTVAAKATKGGRDFMSKYFGK